MVGALEKIAEGAEQQDRKKKKTKKTKTKATKDEETTAPSPAIAEEPSKKKSKKSKKTDAADQKASESPKKDSEGKKRKRDRSESNENSKKKAKKSKRPKKEESPSETEKNSSGSDSTPVQKGEPRKVVDGEVTVEGIDDIDFKAAKSFSESGIPKEFLSACCEGFEQPTAIQANAWPILKAKKDIIGIAATGSGKTLAFLLPALEFIQQTKKSSKSRPPFVLVLAPTRELAIQIRDVAVGAQKCGISSICLYGGVGKDEQKRELRKGIDIVVATPGRLLDLVSEGALSLSSVGYLVLDEADRMLDMGFERDIRKIIADVPKQRQTLMFSATWPTEIQNLAAEFLNRPAKVTIGSQDLSANQNVEQIVEVMDIKDKDRRLQDLLTKYHSSKKNRIIIFALYKKEAARLESTLWNRGWNVIGIHGDMGQAQRTNAINQFRDGSVPLLVATDVAARGLDIPDVEYVINYTFPLTTEDYVHRIGRTGRAGRKGVAHTFFTVMERHLSSELAGVLRGANQKVPAELEKMAKSAPQRVQKKKEHQMYGAHFKADAPVTAQASTHFRFDD